MKMGAKHVKAHKAFLDLSRPFQPLKVYEAMCRLANVADDAIERGVGKLFREGKLKSEERASKSSKAARRTAPLDDFR